MVAAGGGRWKAIPVILLSACLFLTFPLRAFAETDITARIELRNIVSRDGTDPDSPSWSAVGTGSGELAMRSEGDRNVKGELVIRGLIGDTVLFDIPKAALKVRFEHFRINAGKTSLDWGEGFLFNAGDLISGSFPTSELSSLSAESFRNRTDWLLSVYIPMGTFSFMEGVFLPPELGLLTVPPYRPLAEAGAGGRIAFKVMGVAAETGYLYTGAENTHQAYVSLQGNFLVDWYLAVSAGIDGDAKPADDTRFAGIADSSLISFGLFDSLASRAAGTISARLEGLVRPAESWEGGGGVDGALLLFTDLTWAPVGSLAVSVRSVVSPLDSSALVSAGVSISPYPGFRASLDMAAQAGAEGDSFGWGRDADFSLVSGLRYSF